MEIIKKKITIKLKLEFLRLEDLENMHSKILKHLICQIKRDKASFPACLMKHSIGV